MESPYRWICTVLPKGECKMMTLNSTIASMIIAASLVLMVPAGLEYLPFFFLIIVQAKLIQKK